MEEYKSINDIIKETEETSYNELENENDLYYSDYNINY